MLSTVLRQTVSCVLLFVVIALGLAACDSAEERVAKHYQRGLELVEKGEYEKATLEFRNALKLDQSYVPAHLQMADILERDRNLRGAVGHLNRIIELQPDHLEARTRLARIMLLADALDEAATQIEAALSAAPKDPEALALKAALALRRNDVAGALSAARAALESDPANANAGLVLISERVRAGDFRRALEIADFYLASHPKNVALNISRLQALRSLGDEAAVEAHLIRMVELFPEQTEYRSLLARYYESKGMAEAAEAQLRAIAETDRSNAEAALDVVRFIMRSRGVEAGRAELERLIGTAENKIPFELALAQIDHANGREAAARTLLESAIARGGAADDMNTARVQLAHFQLAAGDRKAAAALVDQVLAGDAKNVNALAIRASLLISDGDYDGAILALRTGLNEDPANVALLQLAATAHERNGNSDLAGERLAAAVSASGYAPEITLRYARFLRMRGEPEAAVTMLEEAVRKRPADRELIGDLGMAELQLRDWEGADRAAARLRALGDPEAIRMADRIRAASLGGQQKYAETLDILRGLSERTDQADSVMGSIVQAYIGAGQTAEAVAYVDAELAKTPGNPLALQMRGALHQLAGEPGKAEARFREVVAALPESPRGYALLASLYLAEGRGDDADKALRDGLVAIQDDPGLMLSLAALRESQGDFGEAIEIYGALHEAHPDSIVAANNFASLIADHRSDDPASLERAFVAAKRLRSSNVPHFQDTYGWLQYLRGDYNGALRSLLPVSEALSDNPWVRYHIGMTYAKLGKAPEARAHLQAALGLGRDTPFTKAEEISATLKDLPAQ